MDESQGDRESVGPVAAWHEWVVDDGYASRVAGTALRLVAWPFAVIAGAVVAVGAMAAANHETAWPVGAVGGLVALGLIAARVWFRVRGTTRRAVPVGSRLAACVGPDDVSFRGPESSASVRYSAYERVRLVGDTVVLRGKGRLNVVYPVEIFGPDGAAELQRRVEAARGRR